MKFHKIKTITLKLLDIMPNKLGYFLYHQLQRKSFNNLEIKIKANENSYKVIKKILKQETIELNRNNVLEIGSGWFPLMPYLLKINENINKIYTYDINCHYSNNRILRVDNYYNANNKYNFEYSIKNGYKLPSFIEYYPNQNIINSKIHSNIKLFFSRFVLEHIQLEDLKKIHLKLFNEMEEDAAILHLVSPSDHRAYSDNSISYYDFLKYSPKQWDSIQTKFDYHNRLRLPQYIAIFKEIGFEIAFLEYDKVPKDSLKYKQFKNLKIHPDYKQFSEEEILAGSINMMLKKPSKTKETL